MHLYNLNLQCICTSPIFNALAQFQSIVKKAAGCNPLSLRGLCEKQVSVRNKSLCETCIRKKQVSVRKKSQLETNLCGKPPPRETNLRKQEPPAPAKKNRPSHRQRQISQFLTLDSPGANCEPFYLPATSHSPEVLSTLRPAFRGSRSGY